MQADRMCSAPALSRGALWWRHGAAVALGCALLASQTAGAQPSPQSTSQTSPSANTPAQSLLQKEEQIAEPAGQRVEISHLEDDGNSFDEVRVGGETRSVKVQPKAAMPAYEMRPSNGARRAHTVDTTASPRVWNVLNF